MIRGHRVGLSLILAILTLPAEAFGETTEVTSDGSHVNVAVEVSQEGREDSSISTSGAGSEPPPSEWRVAPGDCHRVRCPPSSLCQDPTILMVLWIYDPDLDRWRRSHQECRGPSTGDTEPKPEHITSPQVLNALRRMGLPALTAHTNPAVETLVNLPTVFYTDPQPVTRTLTLLGQQVTVEATSTRYTWHYGDGDSDTTNHPGEPYPALDITHRYPRSATVNPRVDTTYTAHYRIGNGPWQDIDGTITTPGPTTTLRVVEATPVLSGIR